MAPNAVDTCHSSVVATSSRTGAIVRNPSEGASLATPANLPSGHPRNRAGRSKGKFTHGMVRGRRKRRTLRHRVLLHTGYRRLALGDPPISSLLPLALHANISQAG